MPTIYDLTVIVATKIFFILVSFGFTVGIILMVAPQAFESFSAALQKEYGFKKRVVPKIEDTIIESVDKICKRNTVVAGMIISVAAFVLLLISK